jgi:hypothetical protein
MTCSQALTGNTDWRLPPPSVKWREPLKPIPRQSLGTRAREQREQKKRDIRRCPSRLQPIALKPWLGKRCKSSERSPVHCAHLRDHRTASERLGTRDSERSLQWLDQCSFSHCNECGQHRQPPHFHHPIHPKQTQIQSHWINPGTIASRAALPFQRWRDRRDKPGN